MKRPHQTKLRIFCSTPELHWSANTPGEKADALKQALEDQLGLELLPSREPLELLVIEKAR